MRSRALTDGGPNAARGRGKNEIPRHNAVSTTSLNPLIMGCSVGGFPASYARHAVRRRTPSSVTDGVGSKNLRFSRTWQGISQIPLYQRTLATPVAHHIPLYFLSSSNSRIFHSLSWSPLKYPANPRQLSRISHFNFCTKERFNCSCAPLTSASVSVRSGARNVNEYAIDFFPAGIELPV